MGHMGPLRGPESYKSKAVRYLYHSSRGPNTAIEQRAVRNSESGALLEGSLPSMWISAHCGL